jgi:glycosyltransferase involved in cell wall biosynthesis
LEVEQIKQRGISKSLANIVFLPPVPMGEVGNMLHAADALLVHLKKSPLFSITIPSKIQAYMAVGKPILIAVDGDAAALVKNAEGGAIAKSEDAESIAAATLDLYQLSVEKRQIMGNKNKQFYKEKLSLQVGVSRFGEIFKSLSVRH